MRNDKILRNMEDELTEEMHSEFKVDAETEIKHRCFSVLTRVDCGAKIEEMLPLYEVTQQDIDRNIDEFNFLQHPMQDELTEKMHSEFTIDEETAIKHRAWVVLGCVQDGADLEEMLSLYDMTREQVEKNLDSFNDLQDEGKQVTI